MKKFFVIFLLGSLSLQMAAQNMIGFHAGFLGTHTSVAEYVRTGRFDNLLDSVSLKQNIRSFQAVLTTDFDLGRNFMLSSGFHFAQKGMSQVSFSDTATTYTVRAYQSYIGLSVMIGYRIHFKKSRFGLQFKTGPQIDFAVGTPNNGALYSGPYTRFFMPFCRFNEVDLSWAGVAGINYKLGPGEVDVDFSYLYGLSDILEDAFIVGRSMSAGITLGYSIRLSESKNSH